MMKYFIQGCESLWGRKVRRALSPVFAIFFFFQLGDGFMAFIIIIYAGHFLHVGIFLQ